MKRSPEAAGTWLVAQESFVEQELAERGHLSQVSRPQLKHLTDLQQQSSCYLCAH